MNEHDKEWGLSPQLYDIDDGNDNGQHYGDDQNRVRVIEFGKSA